MAVTKIAICLSAGVLIPLSSVNAAPNSTNETWTIGLGPQPGLAEIGHGNVKMAQLETTERNAASLYAVEREAGLVEYQRAKSKAMAWEMGYLALSGIDAAETIDCLSRDKCTERNPLFGKHPSASKILLAKLALGSLHFAAFRHVNAKDPRMALRLAQISVGLQGGVVLLNARMLFR